jgi:hypothetical protein
LPVTQNGGSSSSGSHHSSGSNNSPPPEVLPPILPAVSLSGQIITGLPSEAADGQSVTLTLQLSNLGTLKFSGPFDINLSAIDASSNSIPLATVKLGKMKVGAGGEKVVKLHFKIPREFPAGTYTVKASGMAIKDNVQVLQPLVAGTVSITE